jgi:hypothetical protein
VKVKLFVKKGPRDALELVVGQGEISERLGKKPEDLKPQLVGDLFLKNHGEH